MARLEPLFAFLVAAAMFGGIPALAILALRRMSLAVEVGHRFPCLRDAETGFPYALALAAAALLVYPHSVWVGLAVGCGGAGSSNIVKKYLKSIG